MRLTIERMRTLVLLAGVILVVALATFLAIGKWKNPLNRRDLPKHLGVDIQQEANGFTHAEFRAGHALFKITASKVEQLKDNRFRLHSVKIEMYGAAGGADTIEGSEFEYDQHGGIALAKGPVEITLVRPPRADTPSTAKEDKGHPSSPPQSPQEGEIRVKTSGLTFDQRSGIASTAQPVQFQLAQASGSAVGATYDSQKASLTLQKAVQLQTMRGSDAVNIDAQHAEFKQADQVCRLDSVLAKYRGGDAQAGSATIHFRDDGSAERLDAANNFVLTSAGRGRLAAPAGTLLFNQESNPMHGYLHGGVTIDSNTDSRQFHGTSPTAGLSFDAHGTLRRAHLEQGVNISTEDQSANLKTQRTWLSPVADLEFSQLDKAQIALSSIRGTGGVVVTADSQRANSPAAPSRLAADDVTGVFGANSVLTSLTGIGHASIMQTTATGAQQSTSGDRLEAHLAPLPSTPSKTSAGNAMQIESATVDGNVVLTEQAPPRPGTATPPAMRATAQRAVYQGAGAWLHLTGSPRVEDGGLQLSAAKIDLSQSSGDAFARGDVKATWFGNQEGGPPGKT
jgi:lipopolysaccharide export system protein LptA